MHIPDGFLDTKTILLTSTLSAGYLAYSLKKARTILDNKTVPVIGLLSAYIFAGQMINFPVLAGTSGHLIGATLATIVVGPILASIIISVVLIIQCLLFGDGGITALGANILCMGMIAVWTSYFAYKGLHAFFSKEKTAVVLFIASWTSVVAASAICSLLLITSHTTPLLSTIIAMVGIHSLIGIGEGIITVATTNAIRKAKPELLSEGVL
ncbi:MAG: cobalamin biosynthesis protein CbiM [Candidatus Margulisiibacteriota bacterium]|nr:MAG: hypothetical protein A2X43_12275 [Candidatus Margulisbacteria bacterium GWD2_39_127]OGI03230.1 MAG: hypothetical protein A2X42_11515 [Candidatus Margulisbacteria bacterium GWF2_38_17]OGI11253.1 MAG: hypothetical protein A2X41_03940 [Candidatus Margulisbacteria bacterium GWE2_39_32]PZM78528.1 MAG: cobalamin biosynthesis protein CbiM [Candidatus Margulisiibacteriota bacterium]HAR63906.1 cobalamin biosynthesis protein CbiM [Candidatus Margulisiibacteriota bacterium]